MTETSHIKALDGVRGIALLIVVFAHTTPQVFPGGNIGVDLFFSLSGFLITSILLNEHGKNGRISVRDFYIRRALRLFPALGLMVVTVIAFSAIFEPNMLGSTLSNAAGVALYVWNWILSAGYSAGDAWPHQPMFSHLWSLSVEEQFYIFWPFVLAGALSLRVPKWLFPAILAVGIVVPAFARIALWESGPSLHLYFRTDLRFDNLMWGAAGAWLVCTRPLWCQPPVVRLALAVCGVVSVIAFVALARVNMLSSGLLYQGMYSVVGALAVVMIVSSALNVWRPLTLAMEFRPLTFTGEISYGLYLWHVPAFHVVYGLPLGDLERNTLAIVGSYVVASLSYFLMEKPIRKKGRAWLARRRVATVVSVAPAQ